MSKTLELPATAIRSKADFDAFRHECQDVLDERYRLERSLASCDPTIVFQGCCAVCLELTDFSCQTGGGEQTSDGLFVPNWREQQVCQCRRALNCRCRALLQFALNEGGDPHWCKAAVIGPRDALAGAIAEAFADTRIWPRSDDHAGKPVFPANSGDLHLVACADLLQCVPKLRQTLTELARILAPGGTFLFSVPFDVNRSVTRSAPDGDGAVGLSVPFHVRKPLHEFGWDILSTICMAGFSDCVAHCYWSQEFGYLGAYNLLFAATR